MLRAEGSLPLFRQMSAINTRHAHMSSNFRYVRRAWFVRPNLSSVHRMLTARAVLSPVFGMFELRAAPCVLAVQGARSTRKLFLLKNTAKIVYIY